MRRLVVLTFLAAALTACSESPFSLESEDLVVQTDRQTVRLTNRAAEPVYFHLVVRPVSPLHDWWPCTDPAAGCRSIAPGETVEVPYTEIDQYRPQAREAVVTWWFLEPNGSDNQVGRMESEIIRL